MSIPRPRNPSNKSVSDIKAAFEARTAAAQQTLQQQQQQLLKAGDSANMASPSKRSSLLSKVSPPSIDAILDVVPAQLRPRWIGTKPAAKPVTPGVEAMKIPVVIEFASPGLRPPVYVGTSLSDPQWEPLEMEHFSQHDGEFIFRKFFAVEEGEYQYKLRLGPGDWWVCDDTQTQVDDGMGNKNNLVTVKYQAVDQLAPPASASHEAAAAERKVESEHAAPLMPHENHIPQIKEPEVEKHQDQHAPLEANTHAPLMPHEDHTPEVKDHSIQHAPTEPPTHAPLMAHEDLSPPKDHPTTPQAEHQGPLHCETHSPLFAHETNTPNSPHNDEDISRQISPLLSGTKVPDSPIPEEADPNDPTLEKFPTDHKGIMEHLERARRDLPEDETSHHGSARSNSSQSSSQNPLPSVKEDDEEEEDDELAPESNAPKLRIFDTDRPANPITPPLTPKDISEEEEKAFSEHVADKAKAVADKIPDHVKEPATSVL